MQIKRKLSNTIFILILFFTTLLSSQKIKKTFKDVLMNTSVNICKTKEVNLFCNAFNFYINKEYDSCYVYSGRALVVSIDNEEKDILNYIYGVSSVRKKLYKRALKSLFRISDSSKYNSLKLKKVRVQAKKAVKLSAFVITKKEGLSLEGGPRLSRGTETAPSNP